MINEVIVDYDCFFSDWITDIDGPLLTDFERFTAIMSVLPHEYQGSRKTG